jgi:hypothetical protein
MTASARRAACCARRIAVSNKSERNRYGAIAPTIYRGIKKFLNLKFLFNT